jgi:DNA-binding transcriptional ArsR family regulator
MSELARRFGMHQSSIDYHLHVLGQAGFVVRRKGARGYSWQLYLNGQAP